MFDISKFKDFYKDKTVLITGHTGFKGSNLSVWLTYLGAKVVGLSDAYPEPDISGINWLSNVVDKKYRVAEEYLVDIRNYNAVNDIIFSVKPDIIFHLAAQALVKQSFADPKTTFETNVGGTLNVLEAYARQVLMTKNAKPTALVCITSDKCYQNVEQMWGYKETDRLGGDDPYSASKGCAELIINSYTKSFISNSELAGIASVRAGNVVGGGDCSTNRLIPDCVKSIATNTDIVLRNPKSTRPWLHVFEPLSGYMLVAQKLYTNIVDSHDKVFETSFNFGPQIEDNKSVGDVIDIFIKNFDDKNIKIVHEPEKPSVKQECSLLFLNITKTYRMLDWKRRWNIDKCLEKTAEWYKALLNKQNMYNITINQIEEYCN